MANTTKYDHSVIETARTYYVLEGKTIEQISTLLRIPHKTIWNWAKKGGWDQDIQNSGGLNLYLEIQKQFVEKIREVSNNGTLTDPSVTDSLWKLAKLMERMMPKKVMLSNIFKFMEDMVMYFVDCQIEGDFMGHLHEHVPKFADYLRKKYTNE